MVQRVNETDPPPLIPFCINLHPETTFNWNKLAPFKTFFCRNNKEKKVQKIA